MKKSIIKNITSAGLALGLGIALAVPVVMTPTFFGDSVAHAQQAPQSRPKRRPPALRNLIFERLSKAQDLADAGGIQEAIADTNKILNSKGMNSYEIALVHRYLFGFYYELENDMEAINQLKLALVQTNVPYSFEDSLRFALAQLYASVEDFDNSIRELNTWFQYQPNPLPNAYFLRGQLYYQMGLQEEKRGNKTAAANRFRQGIADVEKAIADATAPEEVPVAQESWYYLLSVMYYNLNDINKVTEILEFLIVRWPRPQYWAQLGAMYSQLQQEEKQLAVMDVAYRLGFLTKESNLVNMAQLYSFHGTPFLGANVLLEAMEQTRVNDDGDVVPVVSKDNAATQKILGQALLQAREYVEAAPHLELAAEDEEDGELYIQLGHVYSTLEDWENTARAMQLAIDKGDLRREDQAYLYLGQAYFNMNRFEQAEGAFRQARKDERSRKTVQGWLKFITYERARLKRLADAGLR